MNSLSIGNEWRLNLIGFQMHIWKDLKWSFPSLENERLKWFKTSFEMNVSKFI